MEGEGSSGRAGGGGLRCGQQVLDFRSMISECEISVGGVLFVGFPCEAEAVLGRNTRKAVQPRHPPMWRCFFSFRTLGKRHLAYRNDLLLPMIEVSEHILWFIPGSCQEIWETLHSLMTLLTCTNDDRGKTTLKGKSVSDTTMLSPSTCYTKSLPDAHSPKLKYWPREPVIISDPSDGSFHLWLTVTREMQLGAILGLPLLAIGGGD